VKKFVWPYQRLLDIKEKQERAMRAEVVLLTEEAAAIRGRIMMLKLLLRNMLGQLRDQNGQQRISQQAEFMQRVHVKDAEIRHLNDELVQVEQKRKEKMDALMELQKFRKSLERLREKALADYRLVAHRDEQNELDDNINASCARLILAQG
jgi:flagellar biosynthesis chaperone FliJ